MAGLSLVGVLGPLALWWGSGDPVGGALAVAFGSYFLVGSGLILAWRNARFVVGPSDLRRYSAFNRIKGSVEWDRVKGIAPPEQTTRDNRIICAGRDDFLVRISTDNFGSLIMEVINRTTENVYESLPLLEWPRSPTSSVRAGAISVDETGIARLSRGRKESIPFNEVKLIMLWTADVYPFGGPYTCAVASSQSYIEFRSDKLGRAFWRLALAIFAGSTSTARLFCDDDTRRIAMRKGGIEIPPTLRWGGSIY